MKADKCNLYKMDKKKSVRKLFKKVPNSWENKINVKAGNLQATLNIDNHISRMMENNPAIITIKDHKENF